MYDVDIRRTYCNDKAATDEIYDALMGCEDFKQALKKLGMPEESLNLVGDAFITDVKYNNGYLVVYNNAVLGDTIVVNEFLTQKYHNIIADSNSIHVYLEDVDLFFREFDIRRTYCNDKAATDAMYDALKGSKDFAEALLKLGVPEKEANSIGDCRITDVKYNNGYLVVYTFEAIGADSRINKLITQKYPNIKADSKAIHLDFYLYDLLYYA